MADEDVFLIDQEDYYSILGPELITKLSTEFYTRVYNDDVLWFRSIFPKGGKEAAIRNQYEFFIQRFGGPQLYSDRKGHPALRARHAKFQVTEKAAERWMLHMAAAMDAVNIPEKAKKALHQYFNHTAYFLVNTDD